jgi:RNA polymerase sigma-70 factor (ECF subfamily)
VTDDSDLVAAARTGDRGAFDALVLRHQGSVFRTAYAVLGSRPEAEEAAQQAFLSAYTSLAGFRGGASFKTWLLKIAWRAALDRRRSVVVRLRRFVSGDTEEPWDPPGDERATPEEALIDAERFARVRRLVAALPPRLRDALLLTSSGDHSYAEVAEILDVPVGTLKSRVSDARQLLKRRLEHD